MLDSQPNNIKILHNKALCDYASSSFKNYNEFKQELEKTCETVQHFLIINHHFNSIQLNLTSFFKFKINLNDINSVEDPKYRSIFYNYAIILFYNKNYNQCLVIVEKLYQLTEAIGELNVFKTHKNQ